MAAWAIFTLIVASLLADQVSSVDECMTYLMLPNDGLRYINNIITEEYDRFQDIYLQETWYRSCEEMPEEAPPDVMRCGTLFPIWLNGSHPDNSTAGDPPVNVTACTFSANDPCKKSYDIQISYCSDGCYRYYLQPTLIDSAYCFGTGVEGQLTMYKLPRPTVLVDLIDYSKFYPITETVFICDFVESTNESLVYQVQWYMDDAHHYDTGFASDSSNRTLHITETVFVQENFRLGTELSCAVTAYTVANGPPSKRSPMAANYFAGIKILTPSITFNAQFDGVITIQPTVPIGCEGVEDCKIGLLTYVPEEYRTGECTGLAFRNIFCGIYIFSNNYTDILNITVTANNNGHVHVLEQERYMVHLKTSETMFNQIWSHYELPAIPVTITFGDVPTSYCRVLNDPHFTTFDGRRFDNHQDGTHILYQNVVYSTEIQIRHASCRNDVAKCVCGVAVRAGYDVYIWDLCDGVRMGYAYCDDEARSLTVKAVNDREIRITFNYGTYVRVLQEDFFFRVFVYPSNKDYFNTVGICGTFDGDGDNDFHYLNGTSMGDAYHAQFPNNSYAAKPNEFVAIWRVTNVAEDLFSTSFNESILSQYDTIFCVCENTTDYIAGTDTIDGTIPCTPAGAATCKIGMLLTHNNCGFIDTDRKRRRRRSADGKSWELSTDERVRVPAVKLNNYYNNVQRAKREMNDDTPWTEETAREYCQKQFAHNKVYNLCHQVPSVDPDSNIDVCVMDIQLSNGTDWVYPNIHSMVQECYEELVRNVAIIRAEVKGNGDTIYDQIKKATCPNDCNEIGKCVEGKCICPDGLGGSDCSVDLTLPVVIASLLDGGVCDRSTQDCSKTSIYGGAFTDSENLLCKVQAFEKDMSGSRTTLGDVHTIHPHFETYVELMLSFSALRQKTSAPDSQHHQSFVSGYSIMVTNDGKTYSENHNFYVYDSECQWVDEDKGRFLFSLEEGYCFIDGQCIVNGQMNKDDACYFCNPTLAPGSWSLHSAGYLGCRLQEAFPGKGMKIFTTVTIAALAIFTTLAISLIVMMCYRSGGTLRTTTIHISAKTKPEDKGSEKVHPLSFISKSSEDNCGKTVVGQSDAPR